MGTVACGGVEKEFKDAAVDSPVPVDADVDAPNELGPFTGATMIAEVSSSLYSEDDPSMTADGLELYFGTTRPDGLGGKDIWVSTRTSTTAAWGTPVIVAGVNTAMIDGNPEVSADGLTLWLISDRDGQTTGVDIYVSVRANRTLAWSTPQAVTELNTTADERNMRVTPDGLVMYLTSLRGGNTTMLDLYRTTRASTGATWGVPARIDELSTSDGEGHASPALGETLIVFSRVVGGSAGDQQLYEVTRNGNTYGTPRLMTEINVVGMADSDPDLSEDGRTLVFNRQDGNIYIATR